VSALVAVLAGGRGRRMGAPKPLAELGGAPLVERPLAAAAEAGLAAVVVAKAGTPLPPGLTVWHEPDEPFHPQLAIVTALDDAAVLRSVDTPEALAAARDEIVGRRP
jgi:molybdopterin-guanine dinucleotide biosynthesis protein A